MVGVKQAKGGDAVKVSHEFLLHCAKNQNLTKKSYKVLFFMLTRVSSKRLQQISQKEIGEELRMDKSSVSLAIKSLVEAGYLTYMPAFHLCRFTDPDDEEEWE